MVGRSGRSRSRTIRENLRAHREVGRGGARAEVGATVEVERAARGYWWPPAGPENLFAEKSGLRIDPRLREEHRAEVEEIAAAVWEVLPFSGPSSQRPSARCR